MRPDLTPPRFDPNNWYWLAADGRVFSSKADAIVATTDAGYVAWKAAGFVPATWPTDAIGTQSVAAIETVLATYPPRPGIAPTVVQLIAYAEAKQMAVLAALAVSYTLKDGTATLTTFCDPGSITFLNSLGTWVALNAAASPPPSRVFYNLDGSAKTLTPSQMAEFLSFVGARVQATFDALAGVRSAIGVAPATVTTYAAIDAWSWPIA